MFTINNNFYRSDNLYTYKKNNILFNKNSHIIINFYLTFAVILFFLSLSYITYLNFNLNKTIFIPTFILSLLIFILSLYNLEYGLLIFIFFIPFFNSLSFLLKNADFKILQYLFFALFLGFYINFYRKRTTLNLGSIKIFIPAFIFIILITISLVAAIFRFQLIPYFKYDILKFIVNVWNQNNIVALRYATNNYIMYLTCIIFILIISSIRLSKKFFNNLFIILSLSILILLIISVFQKYKNPNFALAGKMWINMNQISATFDTPNGFGFYLAIVLPIFLGYCFYFYDNFKKIIMLIPLFFLILIIYLILLTGVRSAFLGVILLIFFYLLFGVKKITMKIISKSKLNIKFKNILSYILAILIIIVIAVVSVFLFYIIIKNVELPDNLPKIFLRINKSIVQLFNKNFNLVLNYRDVLWKQAINMFLYSPISGVGIGQSHIEISNYNLREFGEIGAVDFIYNYYLQILAEVGIIPLFFIVLFFIIILIKSFRYFFDLKKSLNFSFNFLFLNTILSFAIGLIISIFSATVVDLAANYTFFLSIGLILMFLNYKKDIGHKSL